MVRYVFVFVILALINSISSAQTSKDATVELQAIVENNPPKIKLIWPKNDLATSHIVYRKLKTAITWGNPRATLDGAASEYIDTTVVSKIQYEYQVIRNGNSFKGYGYINSGIEVNALENRGRIMLIIDSIFAVPLSDKIAELKNDLEGDGWEVVTNIVSRNAKVETVKSMIVDEHSMENLKAVYLLGHIPVPYSGRINPDGHQDHIGAWPADVFYGDINGIWTDNAINSSVASDDRNNNVPGDGKYDQSTIPSDVDLQVGRVDFANMDAFGLSEIDLMRQYLVKVHDYKHKVFAPAHRAIIDDNFGYFGGEAFAQSGWRNAAPLVGAENVKSGDYFTDMRDSSYLWSYGCGGGTYTSAGGVGSTSNFVTSNLQSVFTMLFGSYFGDWDSQNNFLRAPLAQGKTLTNVWAGRPHWVFHHMGLGENIGYSVRQTQNNNASYFGNYGNRFIHIALMGDPTLRNDIVAPVSNITITKVGYNAQLTWDPSPDAVLGYNIYMKTDTMEAFVKQNANIWTSTTFVDSCLLFKGNYTYMVRAVLLQTNPSGTYFNLSQGVSQIFMNDETAKVKSDATYTQNNNLVSFTNTSIKATDYIWDFGDDSDISTELNPTHLFDQGFHSVLLSAYNYCDVDFAFIDLYIATGTENAPSENITIYPNPVNNFCTITFTDTYLRDITLLNGTGKIVWSARSDKSEVKIDVSHLPKGMYYIQCKNEAGRSIVKKLVVI